MTTPDLAATLPRVVALAEEAGRTLRTFRTASAASLAVEYKGARDLVTAADRASEEGILAGLRAIDPAIAILSEEQPDARDREGAGGLMWIVDPLDGTTNFAHGHPIYSVSIALVDDGVPLLAVVHAPELPALSPNDGDVPSIGRTWAAVRGGGCTLNGAKARVSRETELARALLATGFSYGRRELHDGGLEVFARLLGDAREIRRGGSACLDLAFVASGIFAGFWEGDLKPHDVAAGALLIEEAGGVVTDYTGGGEWLYGRSIVAGHAPIHAALLEAVASIDLDRTAADRGKR